MKFTTVSIAAFAGVAAAQQSGLGALPECSKGCLNNFVSGSGQQIGGCPATDAKCICAKKEFIDGISCCVMDACSKEDQAASITFASTFCGTLGVQVPNVVACPSKSAAAGSGPSATGGSAAQPSNTAPSTAASSTPAKAMADTLAAGATGAVGAALAAVIAFL
ncbi:hypothetical protein PG990_004775 [Apiospora arundinis]|uniref:CFEM domain-containing protein n=1 Tax=Apiospora arundinis TaxID=335852 RepID=A0ABR2J6Z6_9PEZI